jgi:hypothetical protein
MGPFGAPGRWLRGCLHCHSTNSDGDLSPEQLADHYRRGGFDFIAITDHWVLTDARHLSSERFLVLRGIEYSTAPDFSAVGTLAHVVGIEPAAALARSDSLDAQVLIDHIGASGGAAIVAHPYWSGLSVEDLAALRGYLAIEVFNAHVELSRSRGRSTVHWDDLLTRGSASLGVAVDDSHFPPKDSLRAWTVVRAPELTADAVMAALRAGALYCSTGPALQEVRADWGASPGGRPGQVSVRCSPARSVSLVADGPLGGRVNAGPSGYALRAEIVEQHDVTSPTAGETRAITAARFQLTGRERYVRVEVEDHAGGIAWSNPLFPRFSPSGVGA